MSETELRDFALRERSYIDARCSQPFESVVAPETEYKLFQARMETIDSLERLFEKAEQELSEMRSLLERIDQSAFATGKRASVKDDPQGSQADSAELPHLESKAA